MNRFLLRWLGFYFFLIPLWAYGLTEKDILVYASFDRGAATWPKAGMVGEISNRQFTDKGAINQALVLAKKGLPLAVQVPQDKPLSWKGAIEIWVAPMEKMDEKTLAVTLIESGDLRLFIDRGKIWFQTYLSDESNSDGHGMAYPEYRTMHHPTTDWKVGEWHQIVACYGRESCTLFIDGNLVFKVRSGINTPIKLGKVFNLGSATSAAAVAVDELRIYGRDLSRGEAMTAFRRVIQPHREGNSPPTALVSLNDKPPVVDGTMSTGEWGFFTARIGGFISEMTGALCDRSTSVWLAHDNQALYVAFRTPKPITSDDAFEIRLQQGRGVVSRIVVKSGSPNLPLADIKSAAYAGRVEGNLWIGELKIPYPLKNPLLANFIREFHDLHSRSSWAALTSNPAGATGILALEKKANTFSLKEIFLRGQQLHVGFGMVCPIEGEGGQFEKRPVYPEAAYSYDNVNVAMAINEKGEEGFVACDTTWACNRGQSITPELPAWKAPLSDIAHEANVKIESRTWTNRVYYQGRIPLSYAPPVVQAQFIAFDQKVVVDVDPDRCTEEVDRVRVELRKQGDEQTILREAVIDNFTADGYGRAEMDVRDLPEGTYCVTCYPSNAAGTLTSETATVEKLTSATWQDLKNLGQSDRVLAPFTPLETSGLEVKCWQRTYTFGGLALPAAIVSDGEKVLDQPVTLIANVGGQREDLIAGATTMVSASPARDVLRGSAESKQLKITSEVTIEYDGMVKVDLKVAPKDKTCRVDNFSLVIPLDPQQAKLIDYYGHMIPRRDNIMIWADAGGTKELQKQSIDLTFRPCVFVHTFDVGLAWYMESPEHIYGKTVIEVPKGSSTVRINFISQPTDLKSELNYTFCLHATPIRPQNPAIRKLHKGEGGNYCVFYSMLTSQTSSWRTDNDEGMRDFLAYERRQGIPLSCLYQAENISGEHIPELRYHLAEFRQSRSPVENTWEGLRIMPQGFRQESVSNQYICMNSRFRDMAVFQAKYVVEKYGALGVYEDNAGVWQCKNQRHGCGYIKDGVLYPTYQLLCLRDLYKRIQTEYQTMNLPTKPIIEGVGGQSLLPPTAFADLVSAGEGWNQQLIKQLNAGQPMDYYEFMTWADARREMWSPVGNTVLFLPEFLQSTDIVHKPEPPEPEMIRMTEGLISFCIQHDTIIWNADCGTAGKCIKKIWKIMDDFDVEKARFTPYWKNTTFVPKGESTKVGYYRLGDKFLLLVTNPLSVERREEIAVAKDLAAGKNRTVVTRYRANNPATISETAVSIRVPARNFEIVELSAGS